MVGIAPSSELVAPAGNLPLVAAVEVIFSPTAQNASLSPPSAPLQISVPAPPGALEGSRFIVAQEVRSDSIEDPTPGLRMQLVPVAIATVVAGDIVTQPGLFPGILGGGLFAVLEAAGSGFVTGQVTQESCFLFFCVVIPQPGTVVSNNTNTLLAIADASGRYTLFISGGPFTVTGFNPFQGSSGSTAGNIAVSGSTVTANIRLTPLAAPPITRDGIRNGGFERCNQSGWAATGAVQILQQFGPTSTGVVIRPTEGQCMADIHTGPGAVGEVGSGLKQRFIVPAGVRTLRLDFNFISEEFPEFVGSIFNDTFRALITTPDGQSTFAQVSVNQSGGFTLIGDCFFPGGDTTCGQTGWREASVDLSAFSGTNTPITVELLFTAVDAGDDTYDTHVLVDNIRFGTVWIDAKIVANSAATQARVQNEIAGATEILSQGGLNVRLRNVQNLADPGGLTDTDITWRVECRLLFFFNCKGVPTAEEIQLLALARSATAQDVNVYYVRSLTGLAAAGFAVGPDDFHDINILTNSGTLQPDNGVGGNILAHELGHLIISPQAAGDGLEHNAAAGNFLSTTPPLGVVNRQQSANINRPGAPLVVP